MAAFVFAIKEDRLKLSKVRPCTAAFVFRDQGRSPEAVQSAAMHGRFCFSRSRKIA